MTAIALYAANVLAICILVCGLYLPRHHRRDMALAFLGVNIGVLALSATLVTAMSVTATAGTATGIGIGLFGVLSIVRLRSDEISHSEVAYYVASLAMALLAGLGSATSPLPFAFMVLLLAVFAIADSPRLTARHEHMEIVLDRAITEPEELTHALEQRLGATVKGVRVRRLDLANDLTVVDVQITRPTLAASVPARATTAARTRSPLRREHQRTALATVPVLEQTR